MPAKADPPSDRPGGPALNPLYQRARFLISAAEPGQFPPDQGAEVAFAGRSNSGKSSAINAICQQRSLARTSKRPGRTQLINFFTLDAERRLVDLPGYGYAQVPARVQQHWQQLLEGYLEGRASLRGLVLTMDIRHPLTDYDWMLLDWAGEADLPVHILLTKADKLKRGPGMQARDRVRSRLQDKGIAVSAQRFSAARHEGIEACHAQMDQWLGEERS